MPGGPTAQLQVGKGITLTGVGFGEATPYRSAPAGRADLALVAGGKTIAKASSTLEDGARYTVLGRSAGGPKLQVLRDSGAAAARSRLRVVHAAAELGPVELKLGARALGELKTGETSPYLDSEPGDYRLTAAEPGSRDPLVVAPDLNLVAGTAATAYLIGSGGERTRFAVLEDAASGPASGPATGFGGLADGGSPWLLALLAALATGASCGLLYSRASRRRSRAGT